MLGKHSCRVEIQILTTPTAILSPSPVQAQSDQVSPPRLDLQFSNTLHENKRGNLQWILYYIDVPLKAHLPHSGCSYLDGTILEGRGKTHPKLQGGC